MAKKPKDIFSKMEASDGYRSVAISMPGRIALYVEARAGSLPVDILGIGPEGASDLILAYDDPTPKQAVELDRLHLLLDAVCRYFNTGGTWAELSMTLGNLRLGILSGGLEFPGYELLETYINNEGDGEHVFRKIDGDWTTLDVRWIEDVCIDRETREEVDVHRQAGFRRRKERYSDQKSLPSYGDNQGPGRVGGDPEV